MNVIYRKFPYCFGDLIKIKSWKEMKNEFGLDSEGDIDIDPAFVREMKYLCNKKFVLKQTESYYIFDQEFDIDEWVISKDMMKLVKRGN